MSTTKEREDREKSMNLVYWNAAMLIIGICIFTFNGFSFKDLIIFVIGGWIGVFLFFIIWQKFLSRIR